MAGVVFHVEFGFNDTALTRAFESGNYAAAEKIIRETNNPSSLNEGINNCFCKRIKWNGYTLGGGNSFF